MTHPNGSPQAPYSPYGYGQGGYGQGGYGPGYTMPGYPPIYGPNPQPATNAGLVSPGTERFLKGALIGAAAAYILTNDKVQHALIKNTVRIWDLMQGGIEEVKERFRDAEAELQAEKAGEE